MVNDAITQGSIQGLGPPLYICASVTSYVNFQVRHKDKLGSSQIRRVDKLISHMDKLGKRSSYTSRQVNQVDKLGTWILFSKLGSSHIGQVNKLIKWTSKAHGQVRQAFKLHK